MRADGRDLADADTMLALTRGRGVGSSQGEAAAHGHLGARSLGAEQVPADVVVRALALVPAHNRV